MVIKNLLEIFNLNIKDPHSRILQIQGPTSLEVMQKVTNGTLTEAFGYYNIGWFEINGEKLLVSRSGFTGERGYEIYTKGTVTKLPPDIVTDVCVFSIVSL